MSRDHDLVIPAETFAALEWEDGGLPAIGAINQGLANFEFKSIFNWHLTIHVEFAQQAQNGMPTPRENQFLGKLGKQFDELKWSDNALFLARVTWNGARQFLYRVRDAEVANDFLMNLIDNQESLRHFTFQMQQDANWEQANWFLQHWEK